MWEKRGSRDSEELSFGKTGSCSSQAEIKFLVKTSPRVNRPRFSNAMGVNVVPDTAR